MGFKNFKDVTATAKMIDTPTGRQRMEIQTPPSRGPSVESLSDPRPNKKGPDSPAQKIKERVESHYNDQLSK